MFMGSTIIYLTAYYNVIKLETMKYQNFPGYGDGLKREFVVLNLFYMKTICYLSSESGVQCFF